MLLSSMSFSPMGPLGRRNFNPGFQSFARGCPKRLRERFSRRNQQQMQPKLTLPMKVIWSTKSSCSRGRGKG